MVCPKPVLVEKQEELMCGKHAINNLLQDRVANCRNLNDVGRRLSREMNINIDELINVNMGYYDISVLSIFLLQKGYEVHQIQRNNFDTISKRQSSRLIGYIFGDGVHWVSVRKTRSKGCYYEIDSLNDKPIKITSVKKWLSNNEQLYAIKVLKKK